MSQKESVRMHTINTVLSSMSHWLNVTLIAVVTVGALYGIGWILHQLDYFDQRLNVNNTSMTRGHIEPHMIATVTSVIDGDTITVLTPHGHDTVRILGIDTPETVKPGTPVQCGGPEATGYAHQLLDGQHATLIADPTQRNRDQYHRLLRYITLGDGRDYSIEATRAGIAKVSSYHHNPVSKHTELVAAQHDAQIAQRGIWGHRT